MAHIRRSRCCSTLIALLALSSGIGWATGDPARGLARFQACATCHSAKPGEQMTGPSLANIWHRKAGTVPGFDRYSDAMKRAHLEWNEETLDQWLKNPEALIPGTSMTFPGLRERDSRQDVIAYLAAVSEGKASAGVARSGGMMNMQRGKGDLKKVPPEGQVTAIKYCRDTYSVETADGKIAKVWEFNLRFKTDSGRSDRHRESQWLSALACRVIARQSCSRNPAKSARSTRNRAHDREAPGCDVIRLACDRSAGV